MRIEWKITELLSKVKEAKKDWLYKAGAYLRRTARNSIKKGRTIKRTIFNSFGVSQTIVENVSSPAGEPPRDFSGWRKTFHFEVDNVAEIVAVGPIAGRNRIPPLHEYGGTGLIKWREIDRKGIWHTFTREKHYSPRPTMQPALEKSKTTISKFWTNAIR
ncbi:MAG: hypothetical protein IKP00_07055 [Victivallales bacterium]|nr:hypothetical protein [Victivallales bacterium]